MPASKRIRTALSAGAILVFAVHFLLTGVYLSPPDWELGKLRSASRLYIGPFFHQNFQVFAPEPPLARQRFLYRVQFDSGDWSSWVDPGLPILERHHGNRFAAHGKEFNVYESMAHNLRALYERYDRDLDERIPNRQYVLDSAMVHTGAFQMANRYAAEKAVEKFGDQPFLEVQFQCRYDSIAPPGQPGDTATYIVDFLPTSLHLNRVIE